MNPKLAPGEWSLQWKHCKKCQRTDRPHRARGLCSSCYASPYSKRKWKELVKEETAAERRARLRRKRIYMRAWRAEGPAG